MGYTEVRADLYITARLSSHNSEQDEADRREWDAAMAEINAFAEHLQARYKRILTVC